MVLRLWRALALLALLSAGTCLGDPEAACVDESCADRPPSLTARLQKVKQLDDLCKDLDTRVRTFISQNSFDGAVNAIIKCAEVDPKPRHFWNIGSMLARVKRYTEALPWLEKATLDENTSAKDHLFVARVAIDCDEVVRSLKATELYVEATLNLVRGTWKSQMHEIADAVHETALMEHIRSHGNEFLGILKSLPAIYVQVRNLPAARSVYTIVSRLYPQDHELQYHYMNFLFSIGAELQGYNAMIDDKTARRARAGRQPVVDRKAIAHVALADFGASLSTHHLAIINTIFMSTNPDQVSIIEDNCNSDVSDLVGLDTISAHRLRRTVARCLMKQSFPQVLTETRTDLDAANKYGFTLLHQVASLGDVELISTILQLGVNAKAVNVFGQTALHIAVMQGHYSAVWELLKNKELIDVQDNIGRTALDYACLHHTFFEFVPPTFPWSKNNCPSDVCGLRHDDDSAHLLKPMDAGWRRTESQGETKCDVDIRVNLSVEEFQMEYLSIQKPVLIRGLYANDPAFEQLRKRWRKNSFVSVHGKVSVDSVTIPYARQFGLPANKTTIKEFVFTMTATNNDDIPEPSYIFEGLMSGNPILKDTIVPVVAKQSASRILSTQFFLGPKNSGSPIHFHQAAVNTIVHGRKQWYIQPPSSSVYSRTHPVKWYATRTADDDSSFPVLSCVQQAGDVFFVPEMWAHAVVNLEDSIGFANELLFGASHFEL